MRRSKLICILLTIAIILSAIFATGCPKNPGSSSTAEPVNPSATAPPARAEINGNNYVLTFDEEFNGNELNEDVWYCEYGTGSQYGIPGW